MILGTVLDQLPASVSFGGSAQTSAANFRRLGIHWCLTLEAPHANPFKRKAKEHVGSSRRLGAFVKAASILEANLWHWLGLQPLRKEQAFQPSAICSTLKSVRAGLYLREDTGVDRQIVKSATRWEAEHLRVGKRFVQSRTRMSRG